MFIAVNDFMQSVPYLTHTHFFNFRCAFSMFPVMQKEVKTNAIHCTNINHEEL